MKREEILNNSRELVNQIYAKMSIIEACDAVAEKVKNLNVCFTDAENNQIVVLEEILNAEQLEGIREGIVSKIYDRAFEAQAFLERLNRKPAVINQEFEQAVKEMEEQYKDEEKPKKSVIVTSDINEVVESLKENKEVKESLPEPVMTVEEVKRLYHDENKSMKEIAEFYGVTKSLVNNFISKNHLNRTSYDKDPLFKDKAVEEKRKKP